MLTAIIIDDEASGRETLHSLINNYCPNTTVIGMGKSVEEGLELIEQCRPDVVFLDVEMPFRNGFDLLVEVGKIDFEVIFTTAYSQYAAKAFKFSALDYLLKPIDVTELQNALGKAEKKSINGVKDDQFDILLDTLKKRASASQRIVLPSLQGFTVMEVKDIVRCEADKNYTFFHFADQTKMLVSKTLKEYSDLLAEHDFMRVHQSHLINLTHVKKYNKGRGGFVTMSDESIVDVSRANKDEFMKRVASVSNSIAL
ncbi:MAG: LytTR family DNA-binding domain-containing protein [Bacteroidota bacterium]